MDDQKIRILLLEDDNDDAWQIAEILKEHNLEFELTTVGTKEKFSQQLKDSPPDVILSDHYLPRFSSNEAFDMVKERGLKIPFILVTGAVSEEFAVSIIRNGAADYILKDRLQRLPMSVLSSLQKFRLERLHKEAELKVTENQKKYTSLIQHLPANIAILNRQGLIVDVNESWKTFADQNGFNGKNYGIGTSYIEVSKAHTGLDNEEGVLVAEALEKIIGRSLNNFSMIYPCHSPEKKRWFKIIISHENDNIDSGIVVMHIDVTEQHEAQLKAKKSEANLLSIFNNAGIALMLLDTELNIISCNKTANLWASEVFGTGILENCNLLSLIDEERRSASRSAMQLVLEGFPRDEEVSCTLADGSTKWFRARMNAVTDSTGVIGLCLSAADITEQVLSRKKIEENEKRFQSLIENSMDMKILISEEGKIIYTSPAASKILGYTKEEFLATPAIQLVCKEDVLSLTDKIRQLLDLPGSSFFSQLRLIHKNGQVVWCEGTITNMLSESAVLALVTNFRSITERKKLETLYQITNRLARLGSWEFDMQRNKLYWSEITKEIHEVDMDYEPDLERAVDFYKEGASRDTVLDAIKEAINSGKAYDIEVEIITARQNSKWIRTLGEVEMNNGSCVRLFGSIQDIDVRKRAELERKRVANDLLKHVENLEQFTYIISHNLRAPVANILGLANLLKNRMPEEDRDKAQKYLFMAVSQMDETIKDLNKILQIRAEYSEFKESIHLPELLSEVQSSIQNIIAKEMVTIRSSFDQVNTVTTIKSYLHSVFYNLILNSIKYRKRGVSPVIEIRSEVQNEKVTLFFKDNGAGIDLEKHGKNIFGLYKRFHLDVEGKGLGLYMIKTQIEVLGGSITVKSAPDEGAEFIVELPL